MIGHNSGTLGTIADVDTFPNTFYGNVSKSIEFILAQNPNVKIYLSTLHLTDRVSYTNSLTISNAIFELATYW